MAKDSIALEHKPFLEKLQYYLVKAFALPFSLLPYCVLHTIGNILGILAFYLLKDFRKRTLSNLALAKDLKLDEKKLLATAKKTFQNLAITILEYPKLAKEKDLSKLIICENPQTAQDLYNKKKGIVFFCGHQANWEVLFLDGNLRMKGLAIGKPFRNKLLYNWVNSVREKTGGRIIPPQKALKEGLRGLKQGKFIGIVGDQGRPESEYFFPFLGRRAYSSTAPALLAYRTNSPIIVATTVRKRGKYYIHYSDPIFPILKNPMEKEIPRLMNKSLEILQSSISQYPGQWLWQHNRYKQQDLKTLYRAYRFESIAIILPEAEQKLKMLLAHLPMLKRIYQKDFIFLFMPKKYQHLNPIQAEEVIVYNKQKDLFKKEYRCKIVFNFTDNAKISRHFLKFTALKAFSLEDLQKIARQNVPGKNFQNLSQVFASALCRVKTLKHLLKKY